MKSKICTSIEQSQKLVELGVDVNTADMIYLYNDIMDRYIEPAIIREFKFISNTLPAWSLAALLNVLELPTLEKHNIGKDKTGWMVTAYPNNSRYDSFFYNEPIDACYEVIIKLQELKML